MDQPLLNPSEAACQLGVSAKALRIYERQGLVSPARNAAGWRFYDGVQMARARHIVALRRLGLSLSQIARALSGDTAALDRALAEQQASIDLQLHELVGAAGVIRQLRATTADGQAVTPDVLDALSAPLPALALDLPWPWAGERFELPRLAPVTYLVGPLGSGKTRLAMAWAAALPDGRFIGLDRSARDGPADARAEQMLAWLVEDGATPSSRLTALVDALCAPDGGALVVDLIEDALDEPTQDAIGAWLRRRSSADRPLVVMTRSTAVLDLDAVSRDHAIVFCPANHSPPFVVLPFSGAAGYEALASCLASPEVRQRTAGVVAVLPQSTRVNSPG